MSEIVCRDDRRRALLRDRRRNPGLLNGIDFIEVEDGPPQLRVYFLAKLPEQGDPFGPEQIEITGGQAVKALAVRFERLAEDAYDDCAVVSLDHAGDPSRYTLRLVARRGQDHTPPAGFDPRYAAATFSFQADSQIKIDCRPAAVCPSETPPVPELSYLAKDYASFRQLLLDRLAQTLPDWRERHSPDLYLTLIELLAYVGDHLSYYQDAVATEAYLATARRRISVRRHARLVDYRLHEGCNARAWVCLEVAGDPLVRADQIAVLTRPPAPRELPAVLLPDDLRGLPRASYELFEPLAERRADSFAERDMLDPRRALGRLEDAGPQSAELRYLRGRLPELLAQTDASPTQTTGAEPAELAGALCRCLNVLLAEPGLAQASRAALPDQAARHGSLNGLRGAALRRHNRRRIAEALGDAVAQPGTLSFHAAHNTIHFYTWGRAECWLPQGATAATLADAWEDGAHTRRALRHLRPGDVLIFEERLGPRSGSPADADPLRRHAVRLTRATPAVDPLGAEPPGQPVVEIAWEPADALPFALCLSVVGPPPDCALIEQISVVCGNVLLVDHGETVRDPGAARIRDGGRIIPALPFEPPFAHVPFATPELRCEGEHSLAEMFISAGRYEPHLARGPLVWAEPLPPTPLPASRALEQNPRRALPQVELFAPAQARPRPCELVERLPEPGPGAPAVGLYERWASRPDLLGSGPDDRHFAVEVDDDGRAHLRFGDGAHGAAPPPGVRFLAAYRVGGGPAGNVGAERIRHILLRGEIRGGEVRSVRNPLAAHGGAAPEPLDEARLRAPHAFRATLARAITADDYAALVLQPQDVPGHERAIIERVQRATATVGVPDQHGRSLVTVTLDLLGGRTLDPALRKMVETHLERFRRIGHRLNVREGSPAVPLELHLWVLLDRRAQIGAVRTALPERLSSRALADGSRGFFHPDSWTFGQGVAVSAIVAAACAVPGVIDARVLRLHRRGVDDPPLPKDGLLALGPGEIARLDNDPDSPDNGLLTLELEQQP